MRTTGYVGRGTRLNSNCGITLIETLLALAIAAAVGYLSASGWADFLMIQKLQGHAETYRMHVQATRTEAVARNQAISIEVKSLGDRGGCYMSYIGPSGACTCTSIGPDCTSSGTALASVYIPKAEGISLKNQGTATAARINPIRGTLSPTLTVSFSDARGREIRLISAISGRTRACGVNMGSDLPTC